MHSPINKYLPDGKYPPCGKVAPMPKHHPAANVFSSQCPSRRIMAVLAEKWTLRIVTQLASGPMRTAEIRRGVDGVSEKRLIQTLRKLEGFGLVSRKSYPEVPPRVEYKLTPLGRSLARLAGLFGRWVERNVANLLKAEQEGKAA